MFKRKKKFKLVVAASRVHGEFNAIYPAEEWAEKMAEVMADSVTTHNSPVVIRRIYDLTEAEYTELEKIETLQRELAVKLMKAN